MNENHLMTHSLGRPEGMESLVRFAKKLWEEFVFEVLLGLNLSCQPSAGLRATKQRYPEKAGTIIRASCKFHGRRWFRLSAVEVLVQFSAWNGMIPDPY